MRCLTLVGLALFVICRPALAQATRVGIGATESKERRPEIKLSADVEKLLVESETLRRTGKKTQAEKFFRDAVQLAEKDVPELNKGPVEAAVRLVVANAKFRDVYAVGNVEQTRELVKMYESLPPAATAQQKTQASIQRAALYMKLGEADKAHELLLDKKQCDWTMVDQSQQFLLNYNVGRALTESKRTVDALKYYREAIKLNPRFEPAAERVVDNVISQELPHKAIDEEVSLLLNSQQFSAVKRLGATLCGRGSFAESIHGFRILLFAWAKSFRGPDRFLQDERELLSQLESSRFGRERVGELKLIVAGALEVDSKSLVEGRHNQLSNIMALHSDAGDQREPLRAALSAFLYAVADYQATRAALETQAEASRRYANESLARAIVAYGLNPSNGDAARTIVWALVRRETFNPDDPLRDELVREILDQKKGLLARPNKNAADWQNLLKIHVLLAQYFQSLKKWTDDSEFRSAVFFWEEARRDESNLLRVTKPGLAQPTPMIHENLAFCYAKARRESEAAKAWIQAIDLYVQTDDLDGAKTCLEALEKAALPLDELQKSRIAELEKRINSE